MNFAVFLDRDGLINEDRGRDYVKSWNEFAFLPGVKPTLARLHDQGFRVIVVTNQSCIEQGLVSEEQVRAIHDRMKDEVRRAGGLIEKVYVCPHVDEDHCSCRKPLPGLLIQAASELKLDLWSSVMVGDSMRDIEAGRRAGTRTILVKSGKGVEELKRAEKQGLLPDRVCERIEHLPELLSDLNQ